MKIRLYVLIFILCAATAFAASGCGANSEGDASGSRDTAGEDTETEAFDVEDPEGYSIDYDSLSDNEKLVYNHIDVINTGDPSRYADYYVPGFRENYRKMFTDPEMQAANIGVLNLNYTKVIYLRKADSRYIPYYRELENFPRENLECYLVGYDAKVNDANQYYYNGVKYNLVILACENGTWGVAVQDGFPLNLVLELEGRYPTFDALNNYWQKAYGEPYEAGKAKELVR